MLNGNAKKVSRVLRGALPNGTNQSATLACALAYAAPIPTDACGCLTATINTFFKTNVYPHVTKCVSDINEIHLVDVSFILEQTKATFEARVSALSKPIVLPMAIAQNFTDVELNVVDALVEILRVEFSGA